MGILAAIGIMGLVLIVMAGRWLDRSGRWPALFASGLGMAAALIAVSLSFVGGGGTTRSERADGVRAYVVFSVGMGPVAWLVPSEDFPTSSRAKGMRRGRRRWT